MFARNSILIVEDEPLVAMCLAADVEALDGRVVGPMPTVAEALAVLEQEEVAGAILDVNLADRDITPVARLLTSRGVPFVLHSSFCLPERLARELPGVRLVPKPAPSYTVIAHLLATMAGD